MGKKTRNALEILERLTGDDPELREMIAEETVKAQMFLESDEAEDEGIADTLDLEVARRVEEIRSGHASGIPSEEVFAGLRREFP